MAWWRRAVALIWLAVLGLPALALGRELLRFPAAWGVWAEAPRLLGLAKNTALLVLVTLAVTLALGVPAALLLYRSDLPGRHALRRLVVLLLFVPLPLQATLPRAAPLIGAAAAWVAIQAATEITITDMMQVRTFAEEVYTQFARPDPGPLDSHDVLARAVACAVPPALLTALLLGVACSR